MSIEALAYVKQLDLGDAPKAAHLLLSRIAEHQYNDSRVCRVSQEQLAHETARSSERSVRRWLDDLESRRIIIRRPRRTQGGHALPDEIRIVGFTRWYRSQIPVKQFRRRPPPDKLSGGSTATTGPCESADNPGLTTGQIVRSPPDSRSPVATGQQVSGTYKDYPTLLPTLPSPPTPTEPVQGEGEGSSNRFAVKASGQAAVADRIVAALHEAGITDRAIDLLIEPLVRRREIMAPDPAFTLIALGRLIDRHPLRYPDNVLDAALDAVLTARRAKVKDADITDALSAAADRWQRQQPVAPAPMLPAALAALPEDTRAYRAALLARLGKAEFDAWLRDLLVERIDGEVVHVSVGAPLTQKWWSKVDRTEVLIEVGAQVFGDIADVRIALHRHGKAAEVRP